MTRCVVILGIILISLNFAHAQSGVLPPAVDALVTSTGALAKSAGDTIDLGPSTARLNVVKAAFRESLKNAGAAAVIDLGKLNEVTLLCRARSDPKLIKLTAQRNFLSSVSGKIDALGKPSQIANLSQAVSSLFASQSLDVNGLPNQAALDRSSKKMETSCEDDFKYIDVAYYAAPEEVEQANKKAPTDHSLAVFGPVGSLIDTIVAVITPVVVEGAKIIDEQSRRKIVMSYLQSKTVVPQIAASARELAAAVKRSIDIKRQALAGTFNENLVLLRSKTIDLKKIDACAAFIKGDANHSMPSGAPSEAFVRCWQAAWSEIATQVSITIKSANDYDQLADAGDTSNVEKEVTSILNSMNKITNPDATLSKADLTYLWNISTELLAFADKVNTAASPDNQKKISDAIDKLVKSI